MLSSHMILLFNVLGKSLLETLYMVGFSSFIAGLLGIPLGIILFTTRPSQILAHHWLNVVLGFIVNITRSVPFIILLVALIPVTKTLVGSSIGSTAAIIPLSIGAVPFVARLVENALSDIPEGLIEAGQALGASPLQIIHHILIPEALPAIVNAMTVTVITLVSYSAMAGAVGGGGLGDLALRYGYYRFNPMMMLLTVAVLVCLVQLLQWLGDQLVRKIIPG